MKHSITLICWSLISLSWPTEVVRPQPPEKKHDGWLDLNQNDPRLKARVSFRFPSAPTAEEVLGCLEKATGVFISLAGQPEKGKGAFSSMSAHNMLAWKVMERLAATQIIDGKWEKGGDGYILYGKLNDVGSTQRAAAEKVKVARQAYENAVAKAAAEGEKFAKYHPLGLDPKLHAKLTVVQDHISLPDLLERLRAATGLDLVLADVLTHHDPDLGGIYLPNVAAYSFMELIADKDLDNGRWEKTEDGYRLTGVSKAVRPSTRPSFWLVATAGGGAALVLAGGVLVIRGRRTELNSL